ncbi:hypothetical protein TanjilG_04909 [Lupinus angustifolius]|uniref:Uncharacterized protein n=1 Tax=Lupinus angustifolius TaxID=3871 RepID=A0A394DE90_LUPAN|nr:hypothetical protein TanjilG_04909 [Lupinus angustifolius]
MAFNCSNILGWDLGKLGRRDPELGAASLHDGDVPTVGSGGGRRWRCHPKPKRMAMLRESPSMVVVASCGGGAARVAPPSSSLTKPPAYHWAPNVSIADRMGMGMAILHPY